MTRSLCGLILGIVGILAVGILAFWLLRSHQPAGADTGMVRLVEKGMDTAEDARKSEREMLMAVDRYWLVGVVLAAGIPLLVALLILRECGRREPKTEEIVTQVSKAMVDAQRKGLLGMSGRAELPEASKKELDV